jgi:hypothetical protein
VNTEVTKAKAREHPKNALCLFGIGVDKKIYVAGDSRVPVKGNGISSNP